MSGLIVTGLGQAVVSGTIGNDATFTGVAANTPLTVLAQAATSSATWTETFGSAGDVFVITINGNAHSFTAWR